MRNIRIRKKSLIFLVTIMLIVLLGNTLTVFAESLQQQHQQKQQEIQDTKDEQKKIRSQMTAIQKEVDDLNTKIASYESEIVDLSNQIDDTQKNIESAQQELEKTEKDLNEKEKLLEKRLVASYKAGDTKFLDVLLASDSLTSFLSNYYLMQELADYDTKLIDTVRKTKQQIEESKKALEESKAKLEEAKETQELKKSSLDVAKREKNQKVNELDEEDKALQKRIDEMRAQDSAITAAIKKAEEDERRRQQNSGNSGNSPNSNPGGYIYPVPSAYSKITTGLYYSNGSYHGAIDFGSGGIEGQPVYAVKSGKVVLTQALTTSYGNYIIINHHDGTYTLYAHGQAGSICVSQGQEVKQGQQIMRVGSTGNSTGPHLHFEVRVSPGGYGNRVNPLNYL